ncbi:Inherit from COG: Alpha beta hydrolase [Seminavis robusta]|uniref:Inherit from COG: Alpha beta hydrolase n=1 Tax=Seminavis robusta TaxID=568900 RepID=A0A9N8HPU3_9STRA|nr:Inherit from COG: Alpha beta hydrolase [Seminavis robusta]|eukprot:Sro1103_g241670.1 Inherit from COG: Alpha beta hydrolase (537) ;mRNA; r:6193-7803
MSHGIFTLDDFVGYIPVIALLGFLVYSIVSLLSYLLTLPFRFLKKGSKEKANLNNDEDCNGEDVQMSFTGATNKSILIILALSYLLSPLHLQGQGMKQGNNTPLYHHHKNSSSSSHQGLFDLMHGSDPKIHQVMALMPNLRRGPNPPLLFANRHLQFIPWLIQNEIHRQEGIPYQRMELQVTACLDKSQEHCERSPLLNDTITLDVFPPFHDQNGGTFHKGSPIIFIAPGLRCESQDIPGTTLVRRAYGEGFRSIVINRRGHTPNQPLTAPRWNLFGDTDDLEQAYWYIQQHHAAPHTPFFLHGVSSGTAVVVTGLSQFDQRREVGDSTAPSFVASISVVPGYDISKVMMPDRFKLPYNPLLTESSKDHFVRQNEKVLREFDNQAVDDALAATNLQELLHAVAPFAGYPNATAYFQKENPVNDVHRITTPTLIVNSIDDPCCNVQNIYEQSPYPQHNGRSYAQMVADSPGGILAVTKTGTHCPFLDSSSTGNTLLPSLVQDPYNGGWMLDSWVDRVAMEFYQAALQVYGDERRYVQ